MGWRWNLEGEGVKLVGANERVQRDGRRQNAGHVDRASSAFVRSFTERYAALARKEPVFGQLRNLIECSIVAAFMQQEDVYGQCNWDMAIFGDEALIPVEVYRTPKTVGCGCQRRVEGRNADDTDRWRGQHQPETGARLESGGRGWLAAASPQ